MDFSPMPDYKKGLLYQQSKVNVTGSKASTYGYTCVGKQCEGILCRVSNIARDCHAEYKAKQGKEKIIKF